MELLRIVAISMIVLGHFLTHAIKANIGLGSYFALESIFVDGVNLFFLISGWFTVKFSIKSFVRLLVVVMCFTTVALIALIVAGVQPDYESYVKSLILPVSGNSYWFVMVYMVLMVLAPLLNAGLSNLSSTQLSRLVVMFSAVNIFSCWFGGNYTNVNGYTIMQAIWMYMLAYWFRLHSHGISRINRNWYLAIFILVSLISSIHNYYYQHHSFIYYNSPYTVISSLSLFLYFTQLNFRNVAVNYIAKAAFGCYLLQDGMFGFKYMYWAVRNLYTEFLNAYGITYGKILTGAVIFVIFILIWLSSMLLTPLINRLGTYLGMKVSSLVTLFRKKYC